MTVEKRVDNIIIEYGYAGTENGSSIKGLKTKNVGFGLSCSLPVIVALLSASPNSLLIIENPEAHLHPRGQSKMAELITLAAQAGVQIIIETHSDHIFNGLRKAIATKKIDKDNVKIHFFELNEDNISENTEIQLSEKGRILNYKKGLFDQFDEDLDELLGL
jgi:predicted ATPase